MNIEFDYATFVKWSPDSKAFVIQKYSGNMLEVYKVEKKKEGWLKPATKALTYPKVVLKHKEDVSLLNVLQVHESDVIGVDIACNGKFIMTCSNTTDLVLWDLKGEQLARIDTYLMNTYCAKISPCGRFIFASGKIFCCRCMHS